MPDDRRTKLFSDDDFDKSLSIGDELVFDKPEITKLKIDLTWAGTDLDICAFMLGKDGMIHEREDLVYFSSRLRWKTEKSFTDEDFNPFKGMFTFWPHPKKDEVRDIPKDWTLARELYKNQNRWMEATLPISIDGSVIGSWDDKSDESEEDNDCGETMHVILDEVDTRKYSSIVFAAVVAKDRIKAGETFADAHDPVVAIYNAETNEEVAEYKLAKSFPGKDAVCFGRMDFNEETFMWTFIPMEESYNGGMQHLAREVYN